MSIKISELLSDISSEKASSISADLLDMLQDNSSLSEILEYAWKKTGNPVMLVDVTFNHEASAGTDEIRDEPVWEYTLKNGFMPDYYLNHIAGADNQDAEDSYIIEEKPGILLKHLQLTSRVLRSGHLIGYLLLLEIDRKIDQEDRRILQLISGIISIKMNRRIRNDDFGSSVVENFLTSIIRNRITNPEEIESRKELFGIKLYDILRVITIQITDFHTSEDRKYNILQKVRKLFDRNNVIQFNDYVVVLYDTKYGEDAFPDDMLDELIILLERYSCVANISFPFRNLYDFYSYYVQTVYCMELRDKLDIVSPVINYEEVIEYHMLVNFSEQTDLELMLHDSVKELLKTDNDNDSDYMNTLFTYVNCQQNMSRAAERMQLHYNTLKYRINRIAAMTGIDFNDENEVFSIMLSERILEIKKRLDAHRSSIQGFYDNELKLGKDSAFSVKKRENPGR